MKFKLISLLIVLATVLTTLMGCGGVYDERETNKPADGQLIGGEGGGEDDDTAGDEFSDPETPFTVKLILDDAIFVDIEGIQVEWKNKREIHRAEFDYDTAIASATGLDGTYNVTLHGLPSEYRYNANVHTASNSNRDITIKIFKHITTKQSGEGLYAGDGCIQISRLGAYTATVKRDGARIYYEFTPTRSGTYVIETICDIIANNVNPSIDVYNGSTAYKRYSHTVDSGSAEASYTRNAYFEMNVDASSVGQSFTFAITATSKHNTYPLTVDFTVDFVGDYAREENEVTIVYADQTLPICTTVEAGSIHYPEIYVGTTQNSIGRTIQVYRFDGKLVGLNPDDGYYHLYNSATGRYDGPILYAKITKPTRFFPEYTPPGSSSGVPISFQNIEMPGNKALQALVDGTENYKAFIEGGAACQDVVGMESVPSSVKGYAQYANNSEGVYPVTEELQIFLQKFAVAQRYFMDGNGWAETTAEDSLGYRIYAAEADQWLFACCYYS